jgi:predicted outer membrane repeat protein
MTCNLKFVLTLLILMSAAGATVINVPADSSTIQSGINGATAGDTVLIQQGTYVENINFNGKNIVVGSLFLVTGDTTHITSTVIDGNQSISVVTFEMGEDTTAALVGLEIRNGAGNMSDYTRMGGGIYCSNGSNPRLLKLIIKDNESDVGGGVFCDESSPILMDVKISQNTAGLGGGFYCFNYSSPRLVDVIVSNNTGYNGGGIVVYSDANPSLSNVTVNENTAQTGGGIYCYNSTPILKNVTVSGNTATSYGGGIYCDSAKEAQLMNVTIVGNETDGDGGGIVCSHSDIILNNVLIMRNTGQDNAGGMKCSNSSALFTQVQISNNTAGRSGGGLYIISSGTELTRVTITGNSARDGGGLYIEDSAPALSHLTVSQNAADRGGGIFSYHSNAKIVNSIFWNNTPEEILPYAFLDSSFVSIAYSDIKNGLDSIPASNNVVVNWLQGNITSDPLFADTTYSNYHLQEGSNCINAGTALFIWEGDTILAMSPDEFAGSAPDMGAFESEAVSMVDIPEWWPITFTLHQNYPNPFNPVSTIRYDLRQASEVLLVVYDIRGREVAKLVEGYVEPGYHEVQWNGREFSSGIYIARLATPGNSRIIKMVLLK